MINGRAHTYKLWLTPISHDHWEGPYIQTVPHPHLLKRACKDVCPFLLVDKDDDGRIDATAEEGDQLLSLVTLGHHQHLLLHILSWLAWGERDQRSQS